MCTQCDTKGKTWLSREEAANFIGKHPETLRRLVARGELQRYKQGSRVMFKRDELVEYLTPKPA